MATDRKSAVVANIGSSPDQAPRTLATARVREVWDYRLRLSEREQILSFTGVSATCADAPWSQLSSDIQRRIVIALRDLAQLGNEAAYALGYSRRNG